MNQIDKEKDKLQKYLIKHANNSIKSRAFKFKSIVEKEHEGFTDLFDMCINDVNAMASTTGFILDYTVETKRSETTRYYMRTVYKVTVSIASDGDKLLSKTNRAKAGSGENFKW